LENDVNKCKYKRFTCWILWTKRQHRTRITFIEIRYSYHGSRSAF